MTQSITSVESGEFAWVNVQGLSPNCRNLSSLVQTVSWSPVIHVTQGSSTAFFFFPPSLSLRKKYLFPLQQKAGITSADNLLQVLLFIDNTGKKPCQVQFPPTQTQQQWHHTPHLTPLRAAHTYHQAKITMLTAVTQPSSYSRYFYIKNTLKITCQTC